MSSPGDSSERFLQISCPHCSGGIEYPEILGGQALPCPHCGATLDLPVPDPGISVSSTTLNASTLATGFQGRLRPSTPSLRYRLSLLLAAIVLLALPLAYLGLIAALSWGLVWISTQSVRLVSHGGLGPGTLLLLFGAMLGLCLGGMVLFFLIKPWFVPKSRRGAPISLPRHSEPLLFAFVDMISDALGAPKPTQIEVDCRSNATAGYRRGFAGFFVSDFRLTLGLPLLARLNTRELAGVVAHELGHFRQRVGFRTSYLVRAINHGLARVTRERDAWDAALERWASGAHDGKVHVLGLAVRCGVGIARGLLSVGAFAGNAISCALLRQMELDADRCQIELAGTEAFRSTLHRLRVLRSVSRDCYRDLRERWNRGDPLPEDFPSLLVAAAEDADRRSLERRDPSDLANPDRALVPTSVSQDTDADLWDSHPSEGRRLAQAEQMAAPGLFTLDGDARELLVNFPAVCHQATRLHYQSDLGLEPR